MRLLFLWLFSLVIIIHTNAQHINYGLSTNLNYPSIGAKSVDFSGRGLYNLGVFVNRPLSPYHSNRFLNHIDITAETAISFIGFREIQSDARYTNNYLDANFKIYYVPDRMSNDLKLFVGVRPSVMLNKSSEIIDFGVYREIVNDPNNFNKSGDVDFGLSAGINVSLGDVVRAELKYVHSLTDYNKINFIKGRPSTIEFGLKFSAVDIRNKITNNEKSMVNMVDNFAKGTLLIMLPTINQKEKQLILERGNADELQMFETDILLANKTIIRAFKENYQFSKLLFFMDSSAYKINSKEFNNVFINESFETINTSDFDSLNYFIASFCDDVSSLTHKVDYGLYVYDNKFVQLPKPFLASQNYIGLYGGGDPLNYLRKRKYIFEKTDYARIIKLFNARLVKTQLLK